MTNWNGLQRSHFIFGCVYVYLIVLKELNGLERSQLINGLERLYDKSQWQTEML